jgi:hypothetical protein
MGQRIVTRSLQPRNISRPPARLLRHGPSRDRVKAVPEQIVLLARANPLTERHLQILTPGEKRKSTEQGSTERILASY